MPAHFDAEVYASLRRDVLRGRVPLPRAFAMLHELGSMLVTRHAVAGSLVDAMALRDRFGSHDVFYALLARRLGAMLVTCDGPLSRAAAGFCAVRYVATSASA